MGKLRQKVGKKIQGCNLNNCAEHSHETNTLSQLMERPRDGQSDSLMLLREIIHRPSHVPLHSRKQDFIRISRSLSKKKDESYQFLFLLQVIHLMLKRANLSGIYYQQRGVTTTASKRCK